jgi:hypothetical protein
MTDVPQGGPGADSLSEDQKNYQNMLQAAVQGPIPKTYVNGFGIFYTPSDISLVLLLHNQPFQALAMSYTTAKSLVVDLTRAVNAIEASTNQTIKTIAEISEEFRNKHPGP